ncbi:histidine--tRNA ligase [Candidatus Hydrogenosomobacter endosymbioticus]|uniref:Histidine--tRNA ligase n=1 Tax=Candidatus Hydrogenosomobacter endosymbioticus TaxID=2558174 RepID=A0ABM7V8E3_9PROT|nr:histidine--tRNA ligase [Candidatus Hydrogenosomobacter endosymbioticus]BDB96041.1 histidine--tRNA ligase [Candidatus Hydrogenosomobacter endosymbioticus]
MFLRSFNSIKTFCYWLCSVQIVDLRRFCHWSWRLEISISRISGFPEFLPAQQIAFEKCKRTIVEVFESNGFCPIDTPAVERLDTLLAKGCDSNEIYALHRARGEDKDGELGLRFDLTVPLARYVSQHYGQLSFPYRRYHIAPVWRGERPQSGRYRQFYQCDIDVVGDGSLSLMFDAEVLTVICKALKAIGVCDFHVKVNNRKILMTFFESLLYKSQTISESIYQAIRAIDKKGKIAVEQILAELQYIIGDEFNENELLMWFFSKKSKKEWFDFFEKQQFTDMLRKHSFDNGVSELRTVVDSSISMGLDENSIIIDPSLARGLDYYTGTIYEIVLPSFPELGSISGGGRYDNLAHTLSSKNFPGVGMSIGLTRLATALIERGIIDSSSSSTSRLLVVIQDQRYFSYCSDFANRMRTAGINTELYLGDKGLKAKIRYADRANIPFVSIIGQREFEENFVTLRDMKNQRQYFVSQDEAISIINAQ